MGMCDCCLGSCHMPGMRPGMSCSCGTHRIAGHSVLPSSVNGGAMIYLQNRSVSYLKPFGAKPFREYKTDSVMFLLGEEQDRPPEAS
jgi:hypothetical protein